MLRPLMVHPTSQLTMTMKLLVIAGAGHVTLPSVMAALYNVHPTVSLGCGQRNDHGCLGASTHQKVSDVEHTHA